MKLVLAMSYQNEIAYVTELHEEGEVANGDPKRDKMHTKQTIRTTIKKKRQENERKETGKGEENGNIAQLQ